jgi:hypothetical protein
MLDNRSWRMPKIEFDKELHNRIKRILIEFSSPIVPMSVLFESLGFGGINGIFYGILLGAISMVAIEVGYEVSKLGNIWVITKPGVNIQNNDKEISTLVTELGFGKKSGTNTQKECSDKKEEK